MRDISSPLDGIASPFGPQRTKTLTQLLFASSEPGFTFEPWDITTLYQDRAGTTPVTAAGQSVGYRRDKSGRGNHQVAVSDAKRGVYGWMPKTGRRNLLERTEEFGNAYWNTTAVTVVPDQTAAHTGTITADRITKASVAFQSAFRTSITSVASQTYTVSAYFKSDTLTRASIAAISGTTDVRYWFDLSAKTVGGAIGSFTTGYVDSAIEDVGGGWLRFSLTVTAQATQIATYFYPDKADNAVAGSVFVWGAQLEPGSTATAYQRVVSQYDITEAGVPTCYYVQADGVDDAYVTPTITPNTDKAQVFAGVRKLSDSPAGHILGGNGNNSGQFETLSSGWMNTANRYGAGFATDAVMQIDSPASFTPPRSDVLSWRFDTAGATGADKVKLNVRGIPQTLSILGVPAQGNFGAFAHSIYSRSDGTLPFNGLDFGHAVRFGPNLDAAIIARVESLIARNTPEVTL